MLGRAVLFVFKSFNNYYISISVIKKQVLCVVLYFILAIYTPLFFCIIKCMRKTVSAFTIVELLIVIVVITILAAISIVAYNGIQNRASAAVLKSDLAHAARQLGLEQAESGSYPGSDGIVTDGNSLIKSEGTSFQYTRSNNGAAYCLTATSSRNGVPAFMISNSNTSPREVTADSACPGHTVANNDDGVDQGPLVVSTFAGAGTQGNANGPALQAQFYIPNGIDFDAAGNMYISDTRNYRIRKISPEGTVSTFATGFTYPRGIAIDASNNIYVADQSGHRIRKVSPSGTTTVLAGSGVSGYADGTGTSAQFRYPGDIAIDTAGNVYVADKDNYRVRKITPTGTVTTLASGFSLPSSITIDNENNLYLVDGFNNARTIRKITPSGTVTTVVGGLSGSNGLARDSQGNFYVGDCGNNQIIKVTSSGEKSVFAGSGTAGFLDGPVASAQFSCPEQLVIGPSGALYISDSYNHRIRMINL